jgi:hypothetical protein
MSVLALLKKHMAAASATDGASSAGVTEMRAQVWQELALLCASSGDDTNALFCSDQALQVGWDMASAVKLITKLLLHVIIHSQR